MIDGAIFLEHDSVTARAFNRDESAFNLLRYYFGFAHKRVTPSAAPCDVMQQFALIHFDTIAFRLQYFDSPVHALDIFAAAAAGQSSVDSPRIRKPAVVMN